MKQVEHAQHFVSLPTRISYLYRLQIEVFTVGAVARLAAEVCCYFYRSSCVEESW